MRFLFSLFLISLFILVLSLPLLACQKRLVFPVAMFSTYDLWIAVIDKNLLIFKSILCRSSEGWGCISYQG
jgi:hypothetical protein